MKTVLRPLSKFTMTISTCCLSILLISPVVSAQEPQQANASDLIKSAQRAVGQVVMAAQNDPSLKQGEAKAKPFWDAMKDLNENLEKSQTGLSLKDNTFFSSLASASSGFAQADIGVTMSGSSDQAIAGAMATLGGIITALGENYSKEAARLKQGGELTDTERQQLDKLIAQQDELMKKLDEVEKNVGKNDENIKAGIEKIRKNSKKIKRSRRNGAGFAGGFFAAHIMYDWLWGWHWWWGPWGGWCPGFIDINIIIWDDWIDDYDYDWDLADDYIDAGELGLDGLDIDDAELAASDEFLESGDFSLQDGDLAELTSDLDYGWDDVSTGVGNDIREGYETNFDNAAMYEREVPIETFQDHGMDDFGRDMRGMRMNFDF